jgi:hypothetical protein
MATVAPTDSWGWNCLYEAGQIVAAAPGFDYTGSTFVGKKRYSDVEWLEQDIRALAAQTAGKAFLWVSGRDAGTQTEVGTVQLRGIISIHLPNITSNCQQMINLMDSLVTVLNNEVSWRAVPAKPTKITYAERDREDALRDEIQDFDILITLMVGPVGGGVYNSGGSA